MKKTIKVLCAILSICFVTIILASCTTKQKVSVKFLNYDGSELYAYSLKKGTDAVYDKALPVKQATIENEYTFAGWDKPLTSINEDTTFNAVFTSSKRKYDIVFKNYDGSILQENLIEYGSLPVYSGVTPTKPQTNEYTYNFSGWDNVVVSVSGNAVYTATYSNTKISYEVKFYNAGTLLESSNFEYGSLPVYSGVTPTKESTVEFDYVFSGWNPSIKTVTEEASYTAVFEIVARKYSISFKNYDGSILQVSEVEYGTLPVYSGTTPTKDPLSISEAYTFSGWSPSVVNVTGDAEYTATFSVTVRTYTITFVNDDGSILQASEVEYGTFPVYSGLEPVKENTNTAIYTFIGWDNVIINVVGDAVYTAVYSSEIRLYTITFLDYDTSVLGTFNLEYGDLPSIAEPSRGSTMQYDYTF
ncbi:MAG: hypothetical protein LBV51_01180, partial [Acholeplasmatales bacterium]|nr:hypothetical protein [Acholeplasmatales bacterium]